MRAAVAVLVTLTAFGAHAAEEKPRWIGAAIDGGGATLIYGIPETDHAPLSFACERKGQPLTFSFEHEPKSAKTGIKVPVALSAIGIEITVPTVGQRLELDDLFVLEGPVRLDDRLKKLLASGGTLKVRAGGATVEFPLTDMAEAARPLLAHCR